MNSINRILRDTKNSFLTRPLDKFLTFSLSLLLIWIFITIISWLLFVAEWNVVTENLSLYLFGSYPQSQHWRPLAWIGFLIVLTLVTLIDSSSKYLKKIIPYAWITSIPLGVFLLAGGLGLVPIATRDWGGLSLTLILTFCSSFLALPFGILLALGRQSNYLIVASTCKSYIDVMRSIPLIAVLFFGQLLVPLFLPMDLEINRVIRAVLAFSLFTAAYVAEDIRGGMQAIPKTQKEAAAVLGLSPIQIIQLIVLPQALRTSLPALTNQAIGLLQNTSLMAILGLVELLGISRSLLANPRFIGKYLEVYIWLAALYWLVCTAMAILSKNIERKNHYK